MFPGRSCKFFFTFTKPEIKTNCCVSFAYCVKDLISFFFSFLSDLHLIKRNKKWSITLHHLRENVLQC